MIDYDDRFSSFLGLKKLSTFSSSLAYLVLLFNFATFLNVHNHQVSAQNAESPPPNPFASAPQAPAAAAPVPASPPVAANPIQSPRQSGAPTNAITGQGGFVFPQGSGQFKPPQPVAGAQSWPTPPAIGGAAPAIPAAALPHPVNLVTPPPIPGMGGRNSAVGGGSNAGNLVAPPPLPTNDQNNQQAGQGQDTIPSAPDDNPFGRLDELTATRSPASSGVISDFSNPNPNTFQVKVPAEAMLRRKRSDINFITMSMLRRNKRRTKKLNGAFRYLFDQRMLRLQQL